VTRSAWLSSLLALALAGCSKGEQQPPVEASATASPGAPAPGPASAPASGSNASAPATGAEASAPLSPTIPQAIQGRWGLVPADCTSDRGDAKGLLVIGPDSLRFYESAGKLGAIAERDDSRIRARFAFTGEGQAWQRDVVLDAQDGGKTLIRREYGADAAPGPFRYRRCA
jgi:hypothetical protein